jgi:hypothetical protein
MNRSRKFIIQFFDEATEALIKWDKYIRQQFLNSIYRDTFYEPSYKGLGAKSIAERFIQTLIYIELCKKYRISPEDNSYKGLKRLDLAVYINGYEPAEVGIELKWVRFTKAGRLWQYHFDKFKEEFVKIKAAPNPNKYILQLGLTDVTINANVLNQQIDDFDGRTLRTLKPKVLKVNSFKTLTNDKETNFVLVLWEIK